MTSPDTIEIPSITLIAQALKDTPHRFKREGDCLFFAAPETTRISVCIAADPVVSINTQIEFGLTCSPTDEAEFRGRLLEIMTAINCSSVAYVRMGIHRSPALNSVVCVLRVCEPVTGGLTLNQAREAVTNSLDMAFGAFNSITKTNLFDGLDVRFNIMALDFSALGAVLPLPLEEITSLFDTTAQKNMDEQPIWHAHTDHPGFDHCLPLKSPIGQDLTNLSDHTVLPIDDKNLDDCLERIGFTADDHDILLEAEHGLPVVTDSNSFIFALKRRMAPLTLYGRAYITETSISDAPDELFDFIDSTNARTFPIIVAQEHFDNYWCISWHADLPKYPMSAAQRDEYLRTVFAGVKELTRNITTVAAVSKEQLSWTSDQRLNWQREHLTDFSAERLT